MSEPTSWRKDTAANVLTVRSASSRAGGEESGFPAPVILDHLLATGASEWQIIT